MFWDPTSPVFSLNPQYSNQPKADWYLLLDWKPFEGRDCLIHLCVPGAEPASLLVLNKVC